MSTTVRLPPLFLAVALESGLAWGCVGLRTAHSVFQATVNKIEACVVRCFRSSFVLLALDVRTGLLLR